MNKEFFKIIKEINSLENKINSLTLLSSDDKKRIDRLVEQKNNKKDELVLLSLKKDENATTLEEIEKKSFDIDKELLSIDQQLNTIISEEIQNKLHTRKGHIKSLLEDIQDTGIQLIEDNESIEEEIKDIQGFLAGIDETITEITQEVFGQTDKNNEKSHILQSRIDEVLQDLPAKFREDYLKFKRSAPLNSLLTQLKKNKCHHCMYEINGDLRSKINEKLELHPCPMCKRILMPDGISF